MVYYILLASITFKSGTVWWLHLLLENLLPVVTSSFRLWGSKKVVSPTYFHIDQDNKKPRVMLCTLRDPDIIHCSPTIALCKWMQHCWVTTPNIVGCFIWCLLAQSCMLLGVVAPCLKVVKPLSQQLPTLLLFHALYTWSPLSLQSLMGCILPTTSCCIRFPPTTRGGLPYERGGDACLA